MNLGRFHGAIWSLKQEFDNFQIPQKFNQLQQALNQSIAQPNAQTSAAFKEQLSEFEKILSECPSNETTPSRRMVIENLGATNIIGIGLLNKIEEVIQKNTVTPADALIQFQELNKQITEFLKTITNISINFDKLKIEYDELAEGEFEVGIMIPAEILHANLTNCEKELGCINELFKVLGEVATGEAEQFSVRTIGSSDLEVFLQTSAVVGACVATAIDRIVALYKQQLEIKKIKLEIERMQIPDKVSKPFDDHIKNVVEKELEAIAKDLIKQFHEKKDPGRKNELSTHLTKVLRYMAERIDRGASFEVRSGLPEEPVEPEPESDENTKTEHKNAIAAYDNAKTEALKINLIGRSVAQLPQREHQILMLPEPYEAKEFEPQADSSKKENIEHEKDAHNIKKE